MNHSETGGTIIIGVREYRENLIGSGGGNGCTYKVWQRLWCVCFYPWNIITEGEIIVP